MSKQSRSLRSVVNPTLKQRIAAVREVLEASDPTIGFLAPPSTRQAFPEQVPASYQEFLREVDGMAGGVVMLYESEGLSAHQAPAKQLPGGASRWFCFGAVEDYPLVMDRRTGAVHLVPLEGDFEEEDSLGNLDYFLITSVFGEEYADFALDPANDPWYQLILRIF